MYLLLNKLNLKQIFNGKTSDVTTSTVCVCVGMLRQNKYLLIAFQIIKMSLITCSELGVDDHTGTCHHSIDRGNNRSH